MVFGLIPEPGRIVIGSVGTTRVGREVIEEIEVEELALEWGWLRVRELNRWMVSLWRSERTAMEEGDVAVFPWPLELIAVRMGVQVWRHRRTLLGCA